MYLVSIDHLSSGSPARVHAWASVSCGWWVLWHQIPGRSEAEPCAMRRRTPECTGTRSY